MFDYLKEPTMTDEELEAKLMEVVIAHRSGKRKKYWHRNPEGPQAVARIKELEVKNVRLRLALKSIIRATDEYPAHTFVRMVAHEVLEATDEGTDDHD